MERISANDPWFAGVGDMGFSNLWSTKTGGSPFYIRTRRGTLGVLEIKSMSADPGTVTFRYKLLTDPGSKPAASTFRWDIHEPAARIHPSMPTTARQVCR